MRTDIIERKEEILLWIEERQSKSFICKQLQCKPETLNGYLKKWGIKYEGRQDWQRGNTSTTYKSLEEYLKKENPKSHIILQKMIKEGYKEHKCELCGNATWLGQPIPLELHHKDGNHFNNTLDNFEILCPTCHALQPNNAGKNINHYKQKSEPKNFCAVCGKPISDRATYCVDCYHIIEQNTDRPSREELKNLIRNYSFVEIGRRYKVSDNAVRKWCDKYNLPRKKTEIKNYTDEEWIKI